MGLVTGSGAAVLPGRRLAAGGQGQIFAVTSPPGLVFKKYLPRTLAADPELERRLRVMTAHRPATWREPGSGHMTLAWPSDIVLDDGRFTGFLMPAVDMAATVGLHRVTNPSDRRTATGVTEWARGFTWRYLVTTAANLARATAGLHAADVVIGDFNESNIRTWREARVTLLDCDSMQIRDPDTGQRFFCLVGRPEFTAPELTGADWGITLRHPSSDLFALAVHLYQLLLEGEHPFRGLWHGLGDKPPVSQLAARGVWACRRASPLSPRPAAISPALLPPAILGLFRQAFEDGAINPGARPTAARWHTALTDLAGHLRRCVRNPAHCYPDHHETCPWCRYQPPAVATPVSPRPRAGRAGTARPAARPAPGPQPGRPRRSPSPRPRPVLRGRAVAAVAAVLTIVLAVGITAGIALSSSPSHAASAGPPPAHTLVDQGFGVEALAFSPDGKILATGDVMGTTSLWNLATRHSFAKLGDPAATANHIPAIDALAFSPGGKILAAGDGHGRTSLWNVATRKQVTVLTDPGSGRNHGVAAVAFSPDGKTLVTGDDNGRAYLWDASTGAKVATLVEPGAGTDYSGVDALAFSPDGSLLATGNANGHTYVWYVASRRNVATLNDSQSVDAVAFSPGNSTLATGEADTGGIDLWDTATWRSTALLYEPDGFSAESALDSVQAVAYSPDGVRLATSDSIGNTYLWNAATGHVSAIYTDPETGIGGINAVAFSPDGSTLATGDSNSRVFLWNLGQPAGRTPHPVTSPP